MALRKHEQERTEKILVVDDEQDVRQGVVENLRIAGFTNVMEASSGQEAVGVVGAFRPDIILLDVMMPEMDGYQVCESLKGSPALQNIPVIFVTALSDMGDEEKGFAVGAVDYITKPISPPILLARLETHLLLRDREKSLEKAVQKRTMELRLKNLELNRAKEELEHANAKLLEALRRAASHKDDETSMHTIRMAHYAHALALSVGMDEKEAEMFLSAAPMHDIGKIGVPDAIILKPGKLSEAEWGVMREHPEIGAQIIGDDKSPLLQMAKSIALYHHEKWAGGGYPFGLEGNKIPLPARICTITDVFDALTNRRPYKEPWSDERAFGYLEENAGELFDPFLVQKFLEIQEEILEIRDRFRTEVAE